MATGLMNRKQRTEGHRRCATADLFCLLLSSVFCCLLSSALCYAEELPDPTRPPAEISAPPAQAAVPKDSGLQSVIISPTRRAAIINGQTVKLGAKLGDAKLVEVSESGVVLQGPQGRQVLALFPGVDMKKTVMPQQQKNKNVKPVLSNVERCAKKDSARASKADEHAASKEGK